MRLQTTRRKCYRNSTKQQITITNTQITEIRKTNKQHIKKNNHKEEKQ